jgi:hypothetical protein
VADAAVTLVLNGAEAECRASAAALFPDAALQSFARAQFRPTVPFEGPLFGLFARQPRGSTLGLVVPAVAVGASVGQAHPGDLAPVIDHVNLEGCGPLTGRWPGGVSRAFPSTTGIYQPSHVRPVRGPRVYSSGVVAAGVADIQRLTRFEARAVWEGGCTIVTDSLVPAAVVAAYYGLRLAAYGLVQAPTDDRE